MRLDNFRLITRWEFPRKFLTVLAIPATASVPACSNATSSSTDVTAAVVTGIVRGVANAPVAGASVRDSLPVARG